MKKDYTAIAMVLDRSASMGSIAKETVVGVVDFIKEQKTVEGEASFTLAQFDDQYDLIYDFVDIQKVDTQQVIDHYEPRGMTSLLDAIGRTTVDLGSKLDKMDDADKPSKVIIVVMTDGQENSSREFTKEAVKTLIEKQRGDYSWEYVFLGASEDAIRTGSSMGFSGATSAVYSTQEMSATIDTTSNLVRAYRSTGKASFSDEDRNNIT